MYPKVLMEIQGTADPDLQKRLSAPVTQRMEEKGIMELVNV